MGKWVFEELRGAAVRRQPNETELFKTEQTQEGEYAGNDNLVREVLQNAIDARNGTGPVRVRLAIHEAQDAPVTARLKHYFSRLRIPLEAKGIPFNQQDQPELPCRYLVCEDFGTRGLEGDPLLFQDPLPVDKSRQYFYWFWRNIGRSGKTGVELGRWGLGKTVYRAASRVGCMFGLTIRESDRQRLLMGQAVLQIHRLNGAEYMPEGYWCLDQDEKGLPLPINDEAKLDAFCREWKLTRKTEPGLSIVAPFIPQEIKAERLLQAVAVNFFSRILRGELVVEIAGPGLRATTLDRDDIESVCKQQVWDGPKRTKRHVAPPISFARQCLVESPTVATNLLGREKLPELSEASLPAEELTLQRHAFAAGERVGIRVRLWLPRKQGSGQEGHCDVYLQRQADGQRCDSYYVREGMTITNINSRAAQRGIQALVVIDPGPLAVLLGDTEGAAHGDWDTSQDRPDREWKTWKGRVTFVRKIVDHLVELLTPPTTEPDFDLLSDFFSVQLSGGSQRQRGPGKDAEEKPKFEPIVVEPKWFRIVERAGGFTVSRTPGVPMPGGMQLLVSVAYDLPRGDPLRTWSPFDFEIGSKPGHLIPKGKGLRASAATGNQLYLKDFQDDFHFSLDGFDRHRDLFVRVDEVPESDQPDDSEEMAP